MAASPLGFCTLGMFIIDEIEYTDGKARAESIIGGAGTYATLGARLVAGQENASLVGWIVDMGSDFPAEFRTRIDSWQTSCVYRLDKSRLTTRAWNGYGPNEYRAFKYLTPKLRLDGESLSEKQVMADSFHLVCSSLRCMSLIEGIMQRRKMLAGDRATRPRFVWEPVPDLCTPQELEVLRNALRYVDIVSPNAEELAAFFTSDIPARPQRDIATEVTDWGIGPDGDGVLVVREGGQGCTAYSRFWECRLPAFYQEAESSAVVDPTGGGNTFLGGLAMALGGRVKPTSAEIRAKLELPSINDVNSPLDSVHMVCALVLATIAASYAIQQSGVPALSCAEGHGGKWNGEAFADRAMVYMDRERRYIRATVNAK